MKKYLLGTTALAVAALMASPLSAADAAKKLKLNVGGFMEHAIGYAKNDDLTATKYRNYGIESDAELLFRGNITTDSGIKFDARFELEANRDGDSGTDEMFVQISTPSLGLIEIGAADHVTDAISQGAPKVGWGLADAANWIIAAGTTHGTDRFAGDANEDGDDGKKINYYTPSNWKKATGLQAAFGIQPDNNDSAGNNAIASGNTNGPIMSAGIAFDRKINNIGVYAFYDYSNQTDTSNSDSGRVGHGGGLTLKSGPFTLGGAYTRTLDDAVPNSSSLDGHAYSVGGSYKTGKWTFGLAYAKTVQEGDNNTAALSGAEDKYAAWELGAKYNLGKGINWRTSVYAVQQDEEKGDLDATENSSGWAVVTGIVLGF